MRSEGPFDSALLASALTLCIAACDWKPDHPPLDLSSVFTPEPPASPTPTPLPSGEWSLSGDMPVAVVGTSVALVSTTAARCSPSLPKKVVLTGEHGWYQLTGGRLVAAQGNWDGATLSLEARKIRSDRPTSDCVSETTERWTLLAETQETLAGALHVSTSIVEGRACVPACEERFDVRLAFLSAKPEPTPTPTPEPSPSPTPKKKKKPR